MTEIQLPTVIGGVLGDPEVGRIVNDSQAYPADVLSRLVNRHPASQIDQLMPWAYAAKVP